MKNMKLQSAGHTPKHKLYPLSPSLTLSTFNIQQPTISLISDPSFSKSLKMASMSITASFLPLTASQPSAAARRALFVTKASTSTAATDGNSNLNLEIKNVKVESSQGRRELVAAAVTVAAATFAKVAMADEPPRGSAEAKQKYAPICVTMPTARICRK